jgi:hypothetical protein
MKDLQSFISESLRGSTAQTAGNIAGAKGISGGTVASEATRDKRGAPKGEGPVSGSVEARCGGAGRSATVSDIVTLEAEEEHMSSCCKDTTEEPG